MLIDEQAPSLLGEGGDGQPRAGLERKYCVEPRHKCDRHVSMSELGCLEPALAHPVGCPLRINVKPPRIGGLAAGSCQIANFAMSPGPLKVMHCPPH